RLSAGIPLPYFFGMQNQFLYAPVDDFRDVEFIFRRAGDLVNPAELLWLLTGAAEDAKNFPIQRQLVDAARKRICGIEKLIGPRSDADRPWRTRVLAADSLIVGDRPRPRLGIRRNRNIEFDCPQEFPIRIKHLNSEIAA